MLILNKEELDVARKVYLDHMANITGVVVPESGSFDYCPRPWVFYQLIVWGWEYPISEDDKPPSKRQV